MLSIYTAQMNTFYKHKIRKIYIAQHELRLRLDAADCSLFFLLNEMFFVSGALAHLHVISIHEVKHRQGNSCKQQQHSKCKIN